jgi:hypothetical protein
MEITPKDGFPGDSMVVTRCLRAPGKDVPGPLLTTFGKDILALCLKAFFPGIWRKGPKRSISE